MSINVLIISNGTLQPNTQKAPPKASPRYYSHSLQTPLRTFTILIVSTFFHYFVSLIMRSILNITASLKTLQHDKCTKWELNAQIKNTFFHVLSIRAECTSEGHQRLQWVLIINSIINNISKNWNYNSKITLQNKNVILHQINNIS